MKKSSSKRWTEYEKKILRKHYQRVSFKELQELLPGRSVEALKKMAAIEELTPVFKIWEEDELAILRNMYPIASVEEIQPFLPDRTPAAIRLKAHKMGLSRDFQIGWIKTKTKDELEYLARLREFNKKSQSKISANPGS